MDNIPETEQPKSEKIISLGNEFQLFKPNYTKQHHSLTMGSEIMSPPILLDIGERVLIPLKIAVRSYSSRSADSYPYLTKKGDYLTPANPSIGYEVTNEDTTSITTRIQKLQRLGDELEKPIDSSKASLVLEIKAYARSLNELSLNEEDKQIGGAKTYKFPEEMLLLLDRLRVAVSFPEGSYTAEPTELFLGRGEIDFRFFHPTDSTPLVNSPIRGDLSKGLPILLPSDPEYLRKIEIMFVLEDEQPTQENVAS